MAPSGAPCHMECKLRCLISFRKNSFRCKRASRDNKRQKSAEKMGSISTVHKLNRKCLNSYVQGVQDKNEKEPNFRRHHYASKFMKKIRKGEGTF
jgi:hypothetical protein